MSTTVRRLAAVAGALLLCGAVSAPALAADAADGTDGDGGATRTTWSVQPATQQGADTRTAFEYDVDPGAHVVDYVGVSNSSEQAATFTVYATDAYTTADGAFTVLPAADEPTDVGTWVTLKSTTVKVPARSTVQVPFALTVPDGAEPGDHVGGIVASIASGATTAEGEQVLVDQRVGTRLYVRVGGETTAALAVEGLTVTFTPSPDPLAGGTATVTYTVRNTGTVRVQATQQVRLAGPWGAFASTADPGALTELLPGASVQVVQTFADAPAAVRLTAAVTVTPGVLGDTADVAAPAPATASATVWAVSWSMLLMVAVCLLLGFALVRWRARREAAARARFAAALEQARDEGRAEAAPREGTSEPGDGLRP